MKFSNPLIPGTLIKRYKRFLADVTLADGQVVTAHCANSGSMMGLCAEGSAVWLSPANNPKRKLQYDWELVRADGALVGINTSRPNALVAEAIAADQVPELAGYDGLRREVKYGKNSRIDLLLEGEGKPKCYVEVKNVTLRRQGRAEFPDAVTARGAKHLRELMDMVAEGHRAAMFYLVQRADCESFRVALDIDPEYAATLDRARAAGVEILCHQCRIDVAGAENGGIEVGGALPLDF